MSTTDITLIESVLDDVILNLEDENPRISLLKIKVQHCRLADRDHKRTKRIYAHIGCRPDTICVSKYLEHDVDNGKLHIGNLKGILLHEIGHILDEHYGHHLTHPNTDDPEVLADAAIWFLYRINIWYDRDKIQWVELD